MNRIGAPTPARWVIHTYSKYIVLKTLQGIHRLRAENATIKMVCVDANDHPWYQNSKSDARLKEC